MRTFIAVEFDRAVKKQLADLQARLKPRLGQLKWVDPYQIHLTLKFLGEIDDRRAPEIAQALGRLSEQCQPFDIKIEDVGTFPPSGGVKVVWVGIKDEAGLLSRCQAACEDLIEPLGFPRENRRFSPHLTLARTRDSANSAAIRSVLGAMPPFHAGVQAVEGVTFYQSTLTPRGPIYNALSKHPFVAG